MAERREVRIAFIGDASDLKRATQTAERSLTSFEATSSRVTKGFGVAAASIATGVAAFTATGIAAGIAGKSFVDAASSYEEAASKVNVVFGGAAGKVTAFTKTATKQFGISERSAMDWAGGLGALLRPMGLTEDAAADMSTQLTGLAGDFASFYNTSPEDALIAIKAGLVGEAEPLRRYGILLNEARIKQEAMTKGLYSGKGELSAYARAQSVMSLIMKDSTLAQGDYVRTQDSTANKLRLLGQEWDNFKVKVGEALLPLASWIADQGAKVLGWLTDLKTAFDQGGWGAVWEKFRADLQRGWDEMVFPWLSALPGQIAAWVTETAVPAVATAVAGLAAAFTSWASGVWEGGGEGQEGLRSKLDGFIGAVSTWIQEHKQPLEDTFNQWKDSATKWVDEASADLPGKMDEFFATINKWVEDNAYKISSVGAELGAKILAGLVVFGATKSGPLITEFIVLLGSEMTKLAVRLGYEMGKGIIEGWLNIIDQMPDIIKNMFGLSSILAEVRRKLAEGDFIMTQPPGHRASGGPVASGMPYIVGERGPELFVPRQSGTIVPNGAGTVTINAAGYTPDQAVQLWHAHERMALAGAA